MGSTGQSSGLTKLANSQGTSYTQFRRLNGPRIALLVYMNKHGLNGTKLRLNDESKSHGIEECWRLLGPLVIEQSKRIGDRRALAKQEIAIRRIHLQLS